MGGKEEVGKSEEGFHEKIQRKTKEQQIAQPQWPERGSLYS